MRATGRPRREPDHRDGGARQPRSRSRSARQVGPRRRGRQPRDASRSTRGRRWAATHSILGMTLFNATDAEFVEIHAALIAGLDERHAEPGGRPRAAAGRRRRRRTRRSWNRARSARSSCFHEGRIPNESSASDMCAARRRRLLLVAVGRSVSCRARLDAQPRGKKRLRRPLRRVPWRRRVAAMDRRRRTDTPPARLHERANTRSDRPKPAACRPTTT